MNSELANLQKNISLANHTTFRIGGKARYFMAVRNSEELMAAVKWAKDNSLSFFILGGGSNLLVSDDGFNGLVIKMQSDSLSVVLRSTFAPLSMNSTTKDLEKMKIIVDAGVPFGRIIMETVKGGFSGAEWGFGIPGTIGGAICGNAGRLGQAIARVVANVTVLDENLKVKTLSKSECDFGYRESRFKKN